VLFAQGEKPRLAPDIERATADFSISHAGPWVACAALARGRIGLDLEVGTDERITDWVLREAALKASGEGLRALHEMRNVSVHGGRLCWRGESWHVRRPAGFAGASACIVVSEEVAAVESHTVALAELFVS
jgi:hypothetical protein